MGESEQLKIKEIFDGSILPLRQDIHNMDEKITALYHEIYGVQGNNGMKSDVQELTKCTQKLKLQIARWGGGIAVAIVAINIIIKLLLK